MPSSLEKFCFEADATLSEVLKLSDAELKAISKGILAYTTVQHACLIKAWREAKQDSQEQPQDDSIKGNLNQEPNHNNSRNDTPTNVPSSVVEESNNNNNNNNGEVVGGGAADKADEQGWKEDSSLASAAAILRGVTTSPRNDMTGWSYPPSTASMSTYGGSSPLKKRGKSPSNRSRPSPTKLLSSVTKKAKITSSKKNKGAPTPNNSGEEVVESPVDRQKAATAIAALNAANGGKNTKAATLAAAILRGVTQRQSGKWQAQLYYAGQSRYIGVFDTREKAALAYEIFREKLKTDSKPPSERSMQDEAVRVAREAAFQGVGERDLRQQDPLSKDAPSSSSSSTPFSTIVVTPDSSTKKKSVSVSRRGGRARINPSVSDNNGPLEHEHDNDAHSSKVTKPPPPPSNSNSSSSGPSSSLMEYETYDESSQIKLEDDQNSMTKSPPNLKA